MKKILYYVTDHGLGHATRSVAIIRKLLEEQIEVTVRSSNLNYFNKSLPDTNIISGITDVGPVIEENTISINKNKTLEKMGKWIDSIHEISKNEQDIISKINPNLILSDISAMPFIAAHKAQIDSIGISNFSWIDVLRGFPNNQIQLLEEAYDLSTMAIQLPFGLPMKPFKNKKQVGLVCKTPTNSRIQLRKKLGLKDSEICVFINLGKYFSIRPKVSKNIKIISTGAKIYSNNVMYINPWIEGQDLIFASDLVISKCGYGIISECLTNGIPFLYISDNDHLEQKAISDKLSRIGLQNRILEENLNDLVFDEESISQIKTKIEKNETQTVIDLIKEIL